MDTDAKRLKALELTPIDDVWGIGRKLAPKLMERGVKTALDFVQRPREWVASNMNVTVLKTWEELCGRKCVEEENQERRQSICTSRSFADMMEKLVVTAFNVDSVRIDFVKGISRWLYFIDQLDDYDNDIKNIFKK